MKGEIGGKLALCIVAAGALVACGESPEEVAARLKAEEACKTNLQCIGDKLTITAAVMCVSPVERMAKHSVKWVDETLEPKFSHFRWAAYGKTVTMIGDKVQFQNGFGAYTNMVYECDLPVDGKEVLGVRVRPGRI